MCSKHIIMLWLKFLYWKSWPLSPHYCKILKGFDPIGFVSRRHIDATVTVTPSRAPTTHRHSLRIATSRKIEWSHASLSVRVSKSARSGATFSLRLFYLQNIVFSPLTRYATLNYANQRSNDNDAPKPTTT